MQNEFLRGFLMGAEFWAVVFVLYLCFKVLL